MAKLTFNILKAGEYGRSPIEVIIFDGKKIYKDLTDNTDNLLSVLDTLLKKSKIKIESLNIKIKAHQEAGLTSQRIIKAITKALSFEL